MGKIARIREGGREEDRKISDVLSASHKEASRKLKIFSCAFLPTYGHSHSLLGKDISLK